MATEDERRDPFHSRLELEQVDRDIFRGHCHAGISSRYQPKAPLRAFGGQIAAQALMAAGLTVEAPGRAVHSHHSYFLRAGRIEDPIIYLVNRPREGGSFSTRTVHAVQDGEAIFMMTASFTTFGSGPQHTFDVPMAPPPDTLEEVDIPPADFDGVVEVRTSNADDLLELTNGRYERIAWVRFDHDMPDDPFIQASALTYLSDLTLMGTALAPHGHIHERTDLMLASIDHAMWFSGVPKVDEWMLFAQDTPVAMHGHGLARGLFFNPDGSLVASAVQESLMRERTR